MAECGPSINIDGASDGAPTSAHCDCGWTWTRPDGDRWADTLAPAARAHLEGAADA